MALGLGRVQTLETKLDIYEDLSKQMLDKLERAVTSIQDNTNKTAIILERHENRLDEGDRANEAILALVQRVEKRIEALEKKVEEVQKSTWTIIIGASAVILALQLLPHIGLSVSPSQETSTLTRDNQAASIERLA